MCIGSLIPDLGQAGQPGFGGGFPPQGGFGGGGFPPRGGGGFPPMGGFGGGFPGRGFGGM